MRTGFAITLLLFLCSWAFAVTADVDDATQTEIAHLFNYLKQSNCRFGRNGKGFSANEGADHINKKYHYLPKRKAIRSAENFIDQAASKSSISGKLYRVMCGESAVVDSGEWFRTELLAFRKRTE